MEGYRLSPQQKRAWLLRQADADGSYHAQIVARSAGRPEAARLWQALRTVCGRHEVLRTVLHRPPGLDLPIQVVLDEVPPACEYHDLRGRPATAWDELLARRAATAFDPEHGPFVRADLVTVAEDDSRLLLTLPGLQADVMSLHLLVAEIARAATDDRAEDEAEAEEVLQYADAAEWQIEMLVADETAGERAYWRRQDLPRPTPLPFERGGAREPFRPASLPVALDPAVRTGVRALAEQHGLAVDTVLLTAWQLLLRQMNDGPCPVALHADNRRHEDMLRAVGPYAQWLPCTDDFADDTSFAAALARTGEQTGRMLRRQEFFDVSAAGAAPLAGAGFSWTRPPAEAGWQVAWAVSYQEPFALLLAGHETEDGIRLVLHHDTSRVRPQDAERLAGLYAALLGAATAAPDTRVSTLSMLPPAEVRRAVAAASPAEGAQEPADRCVHTVFEEQAARFPARIAVVAADGRLTYRELDERANRIARRLRRAGVRAGTPVGLVAERSTDLVAGLLGVMKAGGAYLPLDPALPVARQRALLERAGVRTVLTDTSVPGRVPGGEEIGLRSPELEEESAEAVTAAVGPADLAYLMFTSGSTGEPKCVAVTHAGLLAYTRSVGGVLRLPDGAVYATVSTFAADLGHTAVYPSLCGGGTLHVVPRSVAESQQELADYLDRNPVDCMKVVPSHLGALLDGPRARAVLPRRRLVVGGEALSADLVRRVHELAPDCRVVNHYGPTETTVGALTHEVPPGSDAVPLGRPLGHARVHVLDRLLRPAAPWTAGEIFIGGEGVARGYLGRAGLTAERFVPDPFGPMPGARLYRTGDLARRMSDDTLVFLGRTDQQVKIRGYRTEPAEIEAVLRGHPAVREAVVIAREDRPGITRLVGYVVTGDDAPPASADLKSLCAEHLPDYMVPAAFVPLRGFPRTAGGKLDRAALPAPTEGVPYAAPQSPGEEILAAIWADVLHVGAVGRHDNFFSLGGDSILGIQVISRAARAGLTVTPPLLFQHPTVAELAAAVPQAARADAEQGTVSGAVRPTPIQLWFLEQDLPTRSHYHQALLLRPRTPLRPEALETALQALLAHHDALRLRLTNAPGGGWALDHAPLADPPPRILTTADLSEVPACEQDRAVEELAARAQADIDLAAGSLFRAVHIRLGGSLERLVLVAHHLGVDGVSWRILLEDLETAHEQAVRREPVRLPLKTTSFRAWADRLGDRLEQHSGEIPYWTGVLDSGQGASVPQDHPGDPSVNTYGAARTVTVVLGPEATEALLTPAGAGAVHDRLLAAVGRVLGTWTGRQHVVVDVEGHGRETADEDVDVSRTVGWFTSLYPVVLHTDGTTAPPPPHHGIGYGLLRWPAADPGESATRLRALPAPVVRVNYLGRMQDGHDQAGLFTLLPDQVAQAADPAGRRPYLLDVNAVVLRGRLRMSWTFCPALHREETVTALAEQCLKEITASSNDRTEAPPTDFAEAGLSNEDLAGLMDDLDLFPAEGDA